MSSVFVQNPVEVTVSLATQATEVESFGVPLFIVPHNVYSDTRIQSYSSLDALTDAGDHVFALYGHRIVVIVFRVELVLAVEYGCAFSECDALYVSVFILEDLFRAPSAVDGDVFFFGFLYLIC